MITPAQLQRLHEEKLAAYSRENEGGFLCEGCRKDPQSCGSTFDECAEAIQDRQGEEKFEAREVPT